MRDLKITTKEISEPVSVPNDTFERYTKTQLYGVLSKHIVNKLLESVDTNFKWLKDVSGCYDNLVDMVTLMVGELDSSFNVEKSYRNHIVISANCEDDSVVFKMFDTITI